jgi:hypothetical protein
MGDDGGDGGIHDDRLSRPSANEPGGLTWRLAVEENLDASVSVPPRCANSVDGIVEETGASMCRLSDEWCLDMRVTTSGGGLADGSSEVLA